MIVLTDNISYYEAFIAAAECGSVSEAARKLFVSQPAVSSEIAALEESLKVKLFFRSNRGVSLTPEGTVLYDYVKKAFSFIAAGEEKLREISGLRSGNLRIGASDMTLRFVLLDYIERFRREYPDVRISITNAPTPRTMEALRSGQIDFAVVSGPVDESKTADCRFIPVRQIRDIFIYSPKAFSFDAPISKDKLRDYPMMMLEGHTSTRKYVADWLGDSFPSPAIELATSDLLLEFAERGIGISSIVEDFAAEAIACGRVKRLELTEECAPRNILLCYLKRIPISVAAGKMIRMISEGTLCCEKNKE